MTTITTEEIIRLRKSLDLSPLDWDLRFVLADAYEESGLAAESTFHRWAGRTQLAPQYDSRNEGHLKGWFWWGSSTQSPALIGWSAWNNLCLDRQDRCWPSPSSALDGLMELWETIGPAVVEVWVERARKGDNPL